MSQIRITANGEVIEVHNGTTISDLLATLGLTGKPVAVERNRVIVPKAQHAQTTLVAHDTIEIVTFVGGG